MVPTDDYKSYMEESRKAIEAFANSRQQLREARENCNKAVAVLESAVEQEFVGLSEMERLLTRLNELQNRNGEESHHDDANKLV